MNSSGTNNPCPCCGRTKGPYCRLDDARVFCYQGDTRHQPANLVKGSLHNFGDGVKYFFAGYNKGFSGNSALFCLHDPNTNFNPRPITPEAMRRQTARNLGDLEQLRHDAYNAHITASHAMAAPDYQTLKPDEIRGWIAVIESALQQLLSLKPRAMRVRHMDDGIRIVIQSLNEQIRELSYQKADFQAFWQDVLCDPSGGHGKRLANGLTPPEPEPEPDNDDPLDFSNLPF